MYKMTREIYKELSKDSNLKVFTDETSSSSYVWLQFGIKNGGSYRIRFISRDDDHDVAVRVFSLVSVEPDCQNKILSTVNELNAQYRFVKFAMDDDGDINLEYDYPVSDPNPAASARELVIRISNIVDEAYPKLMRAMWA